MEIFIVDGIGSFHVRNRTHFNYPSHFHVFGVDFSFRFHGLRIPCIYSGVNNLAELLRCFVVGFERVRTFHGLELRDDVSGTNHSDVKISGAWEGMTAMLPLEAHWIFQTTALHVWSSEHNFCFTNFGVEGNLCCTNNSAIGHRFHCFLAANEGVHRRNRRSL